MSNDPTLENDNLFIAMVGNVGSGASTTAAILKNKLERLYGYDVHIIRVSDFIGSSFPGREKALSTLPEDQKVDAYQSCGNDLRRKFGNDFLARRCIATAAALESAGRRVAVIFDSFKHPAEIDTLKKCYEERLLTFTVFCPARFRKDRLARKGVSEKVIEKIFERDEFELEDHGQKVRETAYLSDFFVRNSAENTVSLEATLNRYLEIIFGAKIHSPSFDERGMSKAFGAAVSSACLSRQVGAAVYDENGKLLATGCNDVPRFGGGLYNETDDPSSDHRCYNWRGGICHNDAEKEVIYREIAEIVFPSTPSEKLARLRDRILERLKRTRIRDLIEFSRSVHAEMDAIVSVARHGTGSTRNGTLFSKTFPCHSCARHIVAAGIRRVVFVEPYAKSLALKLHSDSITVKDEEADTAVLFVQYEGVSPKVFPRFFAVEGARKRGGQAINVDPLIARPIGLPPAPSYRMQAAQLALEEPERSLFDARVVSEEAPVPFG